MKICLTLFAAVGMLLVLSGCSACGVSGWSNCNQSWDFYEECDLIEGRRARCCGCDDRIDCDCYAEVQPGMVVDSMLANPVQPCAPGEVVVVETVVEGGPAVGDVVETTTIEVAPDK